MAAPQADLVPLRRLFIMRMIMSRGAGVSRASGERERSAHRGAGALVALTVPLGGRPGGLAEPMHRRRDVFQHPTTFCSHVAGSRFTGVRAGVLPTDTCAGGTTAGMPVGSRFTIELNTSARAGDRLSGRCAPQPLAIDRLLGRAAVTRVHAPQYVTWMWMVAPSDLNSNRASFQLGGPMRPLASLEAHTPSRGMPSRLVSSLPLPFSSCTQPIA
jgi:hypothetical protein